MGLHPRPPHRHGSSHSFRPRQYAPAHAQQNHDRWTPLPKPRLGQRPDVVEMLATRLVDSGYARFYYSGLKLTNAGTDLLHKKFERQEVVRVDGDYIIAGHGTMISNRSVVANSFNEISHAFDRDARFGPAHDLHDGRQRHLEDQEHGRRVCRASYGSCSVNTSWARSAGMSGPGGPRPMRDMS